MNRACGPFAGGIFGMGGRVAAVPMWMLAVGLGWLLVVSTASAQSSTRMQPLPAMGLSHDGQHLAWIEPHAGVNRLMLANWRGHDALALPMPEGCVATGLAWSSDWNWLAFATRCGITAQTGTRGIWIKDVSAGTAPRRIARVSTGIRCLQWSSDDRFIVFVQSQSAGDGLHSEAVCQNDRNTVGDQSASGQQLAMVAVTGDRPVQTLTPASNPVSVFRVSPRGMRVAWVEREAHGSRLYVQDLRAGAKARLLVDTTALAGTLRGQVIQVPQWSPSSVRLLFLAAPDGTPVLAGKELYSIPASGGRATCLTSGNPIKPGWFRFINENGLLATQVVGKRIAVVGYELTGGRILQAATWFSVDSVIGNGRQHLAISLVYVQNRRPTVAYAQRGPGHPVEIHAGVFRTTTPPVVVRLPE